MDPKTFAPLIDALAHAGAQAVLATAAVLMGAALVTIYRQQIADKNALIARLTAERNALLDQLQKRNELSDQREMLEELLRKRRRGR